MGKNKIQVLSTLCEPYFSPLSFFAFCMLCESCFSQSVVFLFLIAKIKEQSQCLRCYLLPCHGCRTYAPVPFASAWHPHVGKAQSFHHQPERFASDGRAELSGVTNEEVEIEIE